MILVDAIRRSMPITSGRGSLSRGPLVRNISRTDMLASFVPEPRRCRKSLPIRPTIPIIACFPDPELRDPQQVAPDPLSPRACARVSSREAPGTRPAAERAGVLNLFDRSPHLFPTERGFICVHPWPVLSAAIHVFLICGLPKTWVPGTTPGTGSVTVERRAGEHRRGRA